jgi:hypothetical protein
LDSSRHASLFAVVLFLRFWTWVSDFAVVILVFGFVVELLLGGGGGGGGGTAPRWSVTASAGGVNSSTCQKE